MIFRKYQYSYLVFLNFVFCAKKFEPAKEFFAPYNCVLCAKGERLRDSAGSVAKFTHGSF
jgi:hypothetical protein